MLTRCLALVVLILTAAAAAADETPSPFSTIGVGPNGFDFMIGTWKCDGTMSESGQSFRYYIYAKRSGLTKSIVLDWDSPNDQLVESLDYDQSSKTWHSKYTSSELRASNLIDSNATTSRTVETQSTSDTGSKIVWPGSRYAPMSGAPTPTRETWTFATPEQLDDRYEIQQHGSWILQSQATCEKVS